MEPSKTQSHHVSQPMSSNWLPDTATAPPTTAVAASTVPAIPATSSGPLTSHEPSTNVVTVTSVAPPVVKTATEAPTAPVISYAHPTSSNSVPTQTVQMGQYSNGTSAALYGPSLPQGSPPLDHHEGAGLGRGRQSHSQPIDVQRDGSPRYQATTGSLYTQVSNGTVPQYAQEQVHTQNGRHSAVSRFGTLASIRTRGPGALATAPYSTQPLVSSEGVMHSGTARRYSQSQLSTGSFTLRDPKDPSQVQDIHGKNGVAPNPHLDSHLTRANAAQQHAPQTRLFEGIEQLNKHDSLLDQSQTPTYIQNQQHDHEYNMHSFNRQDQYPVYQSRQPYQPHASQHSQPMYPSYQPQPNPYQFPPSSHGHQAGEELGGYHNDQYDGSTGYPRYRSYLVRSEPREGPQGYSSIRPLPSARSLEHSSGVRAGDGNPNSRMDGGYGAENGGGVVNRVRGVPGSSNHGRGSSGVHPTGWSGTLLKDSLKAMQNTGTSADKNEFQSMYTDLVQLYEEKLDAIFDAADKTCIDNIIGARIPYLVDTITAPVDDETPEDAQQKLIVKKKFVAAMERLQGDQLPTKRRGNLPKECTAYLKKWFNEHYDYPYPSDQEKADISKVTNVGIQQISHWFINHRKRVWKPSLPRNHPAHSGDHNKRQRKRGRDE